MNKLRSCAAATLLLTVLAGLSLPAAAQDGPPGPFSTTTTLSVSGKPSRGATITLTVTVSGDQFVFNNSAAICNTYQPNSIAIYNGNTPIASTQLFTGNAAATVSQYAIYVNDGTCVYEDEFWTTATSYTTTYKIPQNASSVNLHAAFVPASSGSFSLASQSPTLTYRFANAVPAVVNLLFKN
ncbi:hypothetical protein ACFONN_07025 [Dyella humi]|uniref:Spore coat protein U domain-containing protein n=1 Tax=Dyella humi TaxID=1770547 RepID=A0ABW8IKR5_9GAMM